MKHTILAALMLAPAPALAGAVSPLLLHPPRPAGAAEAMVAPEVAVTVRLSRDPDEALLSRIGSIAEPVRLADGSPAVVGRVLDAVVDRGRLAELGALAEVESVEPAEPLVRIHPLDVTGAQLGGPGVWSPALPLLPNLGEGVLIGDYEGAWDIFHPDLFFPDGGLYDFEDVDGDGVVGKGDRVDLDGDGVAEAPLSLVGGPSPYNLEGPIVENPYGYDAGIEWLYVDLNANGERDFGPAAGFDEATPAYGEPIFAGDDVDGDGKIQVGERLVRLGTSKVRAISVDGAIGGVKLYERGVDLIEYVPQMDTYHGNGTTGIAAGGWPGLRRWTGIAPGAELFLAANSSFTTALSQAQKVGVDVMFWEQNDFGILDGSSNFERAVSAAAEAGMIQVAPAGNAASVGKAMEIAPFDGSASVRLSTSRLMGRPYRGYFFYLAFPAQASEVELTIEAPDGAVADFADIGAGAPYATASLTGTRFDCWALPSDRGFGGLVIRATPEGSQVLPEEELTLHLAHAEGLERVRGFVWDDVSGWGRGVHWLDHVSDAGSALAPATADTVIAVSAYGGVNDMDREGGGPVGARRGYAGMGPRVDGARIIDVSAPDDPMAPFSTEGFPHGTYFTFGGTSGATPHVAGVAALLKAARPELNHHDVEEILTGSARRDEFTGDELPNESYGFGKLDAAAAVLGSEQTAGTPPTVRIEVLGEAKPGEPIVLRAVVEDADGDADRASVAWDVGYDRVYEAGPMSGHEHEVVIDAPGAVPVVVQAIDSTGRTARALARIEDAPPPAASGGRKDGGRDDSGCSASGSAAIAWPLASALLLLRRRRT